MKKFKLMATCAAGIEALVGQELRDMGYDCSVENGKVLFEGDFYDIAKTNLWLRTADRIKIIFGSFKAKTFEELFQQTKNLPWENFLPMDANFPVSGKSVKSTLHHVPSCQAITKKAIVAKLSAYYHRKTNLPETGSIYPIEVAILKDIVTLTIDTTGSSLFKRGYRVEKGGAPLKENMAAALVKLTTWFPERPLYDPTCGSGTILIEAAMMALNIAPGINREFSFQHWKTFDKTILDQIKTDAINQQKNNLSLKILGTDIDHSMIEIAKQNAKNAGVSDYITFKQMQLSDFKTKEEFGILISNPPYGERLLDESTTHKLYKQMGETYAPLTTWSKYILTSDLTFETHYGQKATKKRKLYNGALRTDLFQFWGVKPKRNTNN